MHRWGHVGASLLTYAPIGGGLLARGHDRLALAGGLLAAALSTLPDCDNVLPGLDHRGPTHTLWFVVGVGAALGLASAAIDTARSSAARTRTAAVAATVGVLTTATHVAVDSLTPMGVWPFAPISERYYGFDVVPSRDRRANALALALGVAASLLAIVVGRRRRPDEPARQTGPARQAGPPRRSGPARPSRQTSTARRRDPGDPAR